MKYSVTLKTLVDAHWLKWDGGVHKNPLQSSGWEANSNADDYHLLGDDTVWLL
jgi:hypothetical protein